MQYDSDEEEKLEIKLHQPIGPQPTLSFVAVGANRDPNAFDWDTFADILTPYIPSTRSGLVAYGAGKLVAIYDTEAAVVNATLRGHQDRVTAVRWLPSSLGNGRELVTGSSDKSIIHWIYNTKTAKYQIASQLKCHTSTVSSLSTLTLPSGASLLASSSPDCSINIFARPPVTEAHTSEKNEQTTLPEWQLASCIKLGGSNKMALTISLAYLPMDSDGNVLLVLAVGGVDKRVHIFLSHAPADVASNSSKFSSDWKPTFVRALSLEGHEDWIRNLSFCTLPKDQPSSLPNSSPTSYALILASSSQDRKVRLWTLQHTSSNSAFQSHSSSSSSETATSPQVSVHSFGSRGQILNYSSPLFSSPEASKPHKETLSASLLVLLESVLTGHDDWVVCSAWHPTLQYALSSSTNVRIQPMSLLTVSSDKTMMIWQPSSSPASIVDSTSIVDFPCSLHAISPDLSSSSQTRSSVQGLWLAKCRLGEVGGTTLGFYAGGFGPDGRSILGVSYSGSLHAWENKARLPSPLVPNQPYSFQPHHLNTFTLFSTLLATSGPNGSVVSCSWDEDENFLYVCSADQTTRVYSPYSEPFRRSTLLRNTVSSSSSSSSSSSLPFASYSYYSFPRFYELARPQTHGFDMRCVAALPAKIRSFPENFLENKQQQDSASDSLDLVLGLGERFRFASGAEEKVTRIFSAPTFVYSTFQLWTGAQHRSQQQQQQFEQRVLLCKEEEELEQKRQQRQKEYLQMLIDMLQQQQQQRHQQPPSSITLLQSRKTTSKARLPQLGLSNKAVEDEQTGNSKRSTKSKSALGSVSASPLSEVAIAASTLFIEQDKLYGHAYEISCLACSKDGELIVVACTARSTKNAVLRVYETFHFTEVAVLSAHNLTVVGLCFSEDDSLLLSCSRDRHVCLWQRTRTIVSGEQTTTPTPSSLSSSPARLPVQNTFSLLYKIKAHTRVIFAASFASFSNSLFATASRDKKVKFFSNTGSSSSNCPWIQTAALPDFDSPPTALAWAPLPLNSHCYVLAVGLEDGRVEVFSSPKEQMDWKLLTRIDGCFCASDAIHTLTWRRNKSLQPLLLTTSDENNSTLAVADQEYWSSHPSNSSQALQLACASQDHSIRIFTFALKDLLQA